MQPEDVVYHLPWLPPGWRFLKAGWLGETLTCLQPCPARAHSRRPGTQSKRDWILEDVLSGRKPGTAIQIPDLAKSDWASRALAALRTIPFGTTITYKELATLAGNPLAARAAARVCASNRICLVVPCHRIIPGAGGVGGFYWGPALKEKMLLWESGQAEPGPIRPV
ncbi:MAG: methylated-DNA--[protein]-cysteine S-methyltransferase [Gemmataceae bacterium]